MHCHFQHSSGAAKHTTVKLKGFSIRENVRDGGAHMFFSTETAIWTPKIVKIF